MLNPNILENNDSKGFLIIYTRNSKKIINKYFKHTVTKL